MQEPRNPARSYLIAHACFQCRKSFKVSPRPEFSALCPQCGGTIFEMGRSFKAPASRDSEQWAKVEALYAAGFRFSSYRSADGPPLPDRLAEVESFIRNNPAHPLRVAAPNNSLKRTNQSLRD
jgi:predicted  nucleic acid-binding Zn-ribbon protein